MKQKTLQEPLIIKGIGLHSGAESLLELKPAPENSGIVFCKSDLQNNIEIKASYQNVVNTQNCTCLGQGEHMVSTIEHLMAALYICGLDNLYIKCSSVELPIMDGSAKDFMEILNHAPKLEQNAPKNYLKLKKEIRFEDNHGNYIVMAPNNDQKMHISFDIEFPSKIVGNQHFENDVDETIFEKQIAPCRTFCEKYQVDYLKSIGLIKGGSLENAVVLDGENILNPEGFRVKNECVNHKVLDLIGDMYTSGYSILANIKAHRTGHFHNNEILKILFSNPENYQIV